LKKQLALNTASNVFTLFLKLGITFVMTPVLVKSMGNYDYGLWEMVAAIVGYMGILDLGIRPAVSRFAARHIALDDKPALTRLYATSWYFLLAVGIFVALNIASWGLLFPGTIAQPDEPQSRYTIWLLIIAAQLLITFPSYTAESYMEAYQEFYLKNNITIVNSIIGSAVILYWITPSNALLLLAAVNSIGVSIKYIFLVWYVQYKRKFLSFKWSYFSLVQLKELLRFSIKTVVQGIAGRIENASNTVLIGIAMGPAFVPLYSIPANLINYIRMISMNLTLVFMPYFSSLNANGEHKKTQKVYLFASKITIGIILILSVGVLILGEDFLRIWIGNDIANSSRDIIWLLVLSSVLPMLNPFSNRYLTAIDKHGFIAKWSVVVSLANLALSIALVGPLGIKGIVIGSLIPSLIFQPILLAYCCKYLDISVMTYFRYVIIPYAIPASLMAITTILLVHMWGLDAYFLLLSIAAIGTLVFILSACLFSLNRDERGQILDLIKRNKKSLD
jgi:O-antigen/teichoic acid export membrane protein